jgi:two-component system cell cycle sensor histidine kinase/response regulator CckA
MSDDPYLRQQRALVMLTGADIIGGDDLQAAFRRITEVDATTLDVARSSIWRFNEARTSIACVDLYEYPAGRHSSGTELLAVDYPTYFRALAGTPVLAVDDARADPRTREFNDSYLIPLGITSLMDAPIHVGGVIEGVLCREHVGPPRHWTTEETTFAVGVANLVSLALARFERARAEAAMRLQSAALNAASDAVAITDRLGTIEWVNVAFTEITGYTLDEAIGRNPRDLVKSGVQDQAHYTRLWDTVLTGQVWRGEMINRRKDGHLFPVELTITPIRDDDGGIEHFIAVQRDLSEEKRLEAQFLQAQKMETVGRLAGGIAHDFNNLLTVINGTVDLLAMNMQVSDPLYADLQQIKVAGTRAASLTRQLLAFSRKQIMSLEALNLGTMVADWRGMLQRLIGEDIDLVVAPAAHTGIVRVHPSQIEQVLMNLAVNARDAMPDGGTLTIETRDVGIDRASASMYVDAPPGDYVMLSVADTGVGMDATTRAQIFEPFFTTKEPGKGTGLGLTTVFGIVKQSGGGLSVDRDPGIGSTFWLYVPRVSESHRPDEARPATTLAPGHETVMVVEDEEPLRALATRILGTAGYQALSVANGREALAVLERHPHPVHLLFTDVVLPGIHGRELATRAAATRPEIVVLFTSGYTEDAILRHGVLDSVAHFIGKPYTASDLTRKVRSLLDAAEHNSPST